jgi:hypothetical protein
MFLFKSHNLYHTIRPMSQNDLDVIPISSQSCLHTNEAIMKHNNIAFITQQCTRIEIDNKTAYHQAGHAAAICLGNKQRQLPDVYFHITIRQPEWNGQTSQELAARLYGKDTVKVEGGRLIKHLPVSSDEVVPYCLWPQHIDYLNAFEADVVNLLVGSLAEAKYVALRDGEVFNAHLVNLDALHFYGGSSDLEVISEYMECFIPCKKERRHKLSELFMTAYHFVNKRKNWRAISALAEFIMDEPDDIINCEKVVSVLEARLVA